MIEIVRLCGLVAPVFVLIGVGIVLRRVQWLTPEADTSLLRVGVNLLFPCLIFQSVVGNASLHDPRNLLWPPLVGFASMVLGWVVGWWTGRLIGLEGGPHRRTFAFTVGFYNYGYVPIPLVSSLFGAGTLGVLFVHNVGVELSIWTIGILLLTGGSIRDRWRQLLNPPVVSLVLAVGLNALQVPVPALLRLTVGALAGCAVPLGLVLIGAILAEHLRAPRALLAPRVLAAALVVRLGLLSIVFLAAARWLPVSVELKQVMVVQAAMPAGVFPIVLAKHYGGQPRTAAQVVVGTTLASVLLTPLWLKIGLWWTGL